MLLLAWLGGVSVMAMGIGLMRGTDTRLGWAVWGLGVAVIVLQRIPGVFNA